jgi:hypothetical protein
MDLGTDDDVALDVDSVFRLVRQVGRTILHLCDAAGPVGLRHPLLVRDLLLVATLTVEAPKIFVSGLLDACLLRQLAQVLIPVVASVPANDRLHRGISLERGRIHCQSPALENPGLAGDRQDHREDLFMYFQWQASTNHRQARMFRSPLRRIDPQEALERTTIGATPCDPSLRTDPFEVANEEHPEVHPWWNRRPTLLVCVERLAELLDGLIELRAT